MNLAASSSDNTDCQQLANLLDIDESLLLKNTSYISNTSNKMNKRPKGYLSLKRDKSEQENTLINKEMPSTSTSKRTKVSQSTQPLNKVEDYFLDSFPCFEDTQTLIMNSKGATTSDKLNVLSYETQTALNKEKVCQKLSDISNAIAKPSTSNAYDDFFIRNSQFTLTSNSPKTYATLTTMKVEKSNEVKLEDIFVPKSQINILNEFSEDSFNNMQTPSSKNEKDLNESDFFSSLFIRSNSQEKCNEKRANINNNNLTTETFSQFSQFSDDTQLQKQITDAILKSEDVKRESTNIANKSLDDIVMKFVTDYPKNTQNSKAAKKSPIRYGTQLWDDTLNNVLSQAFLTTQYKKEVESAFDQVEKSIYQCGVNQDQTIKPEVTLTREKIEEVLEKTFKSPQLVQQIIKTAEENAQDGWVDNTVLANAMINVSVQGESIGNIIRKALMENVDKDLSLPMLVNLTMNEEDVEFKNCGPFYGLPSKVKDLVKLYKGIDELYEWQDECLNLASIKSRNNLIYALPTSGGKTLVAEILILREILCRKKNVLFILPYVAIVQEKVWALSPFAVPLEFLIEEYAAGKGTYPPRKRRRKNSIYVATIEKAHGLINSLIETNRLSEIGLVVVDELHLLGDTSRGCNLEAALTKIVHSKENIQIIGMSATIGNLSEISEFLNASVYTNNFRPVQLVEYIKCDNEIAKIAWNSADEDFMVLERKINYNYSEAVKKIDPDHLGGLVMEVIPQASCLIFCRSKQNCENVAILLCKVIYSNLKNHKAKEKEQILKALQEESGLLCKVLKTTIPFGIAYHHSGLTSEERRIIEEGFRQGIISVICCTSTLAAGVNLPAKRVIIRNPYIGRDFINLSRYKQMIGRAGRAGFGELGESILVVTPQELPQMREILRSPMDLALSAMHENEGYGLRQFLLSCISLGVATTKGELQEVAGGTLMAVQKERFGVDVKKLTRQAIRELFKMGALQVQDDNTNKENISLRLDNTLPEPSTSAVQETASGTTKNLVYVTNDSKLQISKLGMAAIKGGLDLAKAHILYDDLVKAQCSLVLFTGLHLMYLVTPYDVAEQVHPQKALYYNLYSQLTVREIQTANVLGLTEAVATKLLSNKKITEIPQRVLNRFYVTLMLHDLWNEVPLYEVAAKYEVNRGLIQNLMTSAASFASNVVNFCEQLEEFWAFSLLLKGMSERLSHCCVRELMPLMELPSVKQTRAKQLFQAGYKTLQSVAKADPNDLVEKIEYMSKKLANQLIAASKMILLERVENLREEAEDVLDGVQI